MKTIPKKCPRCKAAAFAALFTLSFLSGCTVFDGSLESLLRTPKLTETQTAIYNALILSTGDQVELVYPAGGEYRSAFVLYDLDDEETEEAIVFYREKNPAESGESGLRMNFLDQTASGWTSVMDRPVAGTKIESVNFYNFNENVTIAVSCSVLAQAEKSLSLLKYGGGQAEEQFKTSFSFAEAGDFDGDGLDELFYVSFDAIMGYNRAEILGIRDGSPDGVPEVLSAVPLNRDVSNVQRLNRQRLNENECLLFIDYSKGDNAYGTQILLSYKNNLTEVISEGLNRRANSYTPLLYSTDIDGDGRIEAPATNALLGYENRTVPEQLYSVDWYYADENNNKTLTKKSTSFISAGGEYLFYIPVRWQGLVTAEKSGNTISFVKYDESSLVLLSICVCETKPEGDGWTSRGSGVYVRNPEYSDPMILTSDELDNCLINLL